MVCKCKETSVLACVKSKIDEGLNPKPSCKICYAEYDVDMMLVNGQLWILMCNPTLSIDLYNYLQDGMYYIIQLPSFFLQSQATSPSTQDNANRSSPGPTQHAVLSKSPSSWLVSQAYTIL